MNWLCIFAFILWSNNKSNNESIRTPKTASQKFGYDNTKIVRGFEVNSFKT